MALVYVLTRTWVAFSSSKIIVEGSLWSEEMCEYGPVDVPLVHPLFLVNHIHSFNPLY